MVSGDSEKLLYIREVNRIRIQGGLLCGSKWVIFMNALSSLGSAAVCWSQQVSCL